MTLPMTTTAPGVPTTYAEVLDPAWLGMALSDIAEGERLVAVEPVGTSKTLAEKLRFSLIVEGLDGELRDAGNLLEAVKKTSAHEITCVIHGDTHSGNSYLDARGAACWLNWQVVQRGNWATDVAYHIATVLDVEDRRDHEAGLLRHYLLQMEKLGAPVPSWEEAWALYASSFAWGYFLWVITRISSRAVVLVHIPRLAAALADHDTYRRLGVI
jgi:hypothetical protein